MTTADRPEFIALLMALADIHGRKLSELVVEMTYRALEHLPADELFPAMNASVRAKFFPKPGDLIERVTAERKRRMLEKSTREALSEGPGEPIALPAGHGPLAMAPAKPVKRIKLTGTDPTPVAVVAERQRRASETWDQSMARLRRQRMALGLTDADIENAKKEAS